MGGVNAAYGLKYGTDKAQKADIYWPDGETPPDGWLTVMAIHGMGGTEKSFKHFCTVIARTGRQCISIDYASMNKGFTGMVLSSDQAIDWALAEAIDWALTPRVASTYNIDTKTGIVLFGQSRGGFIVGDLMWNQAFDQSRLAGGIIANGVRRPHLDFIETISLPCEVCLPMLVMNAEGDRVVN